MADDVAEEGGQVWRAIPWRVSVAAGAGAALAVYSGLVLLLTAEVASMGQATGSATGRAILSGTLGDFYGAHLGATADLALGVRGVGAVPTAVYYALPPVALGWSGWLVGRRIDGTGAPRTAAVWGASIVVGYLPAVVLGLVVLAAGFAGNIVGLSPLRVLVVAGIGFPLGCGSLGGYAAGLSWDEKP